MRSCKIDKNLESIIIGDSVVACDTIMNAVVKSYGNLAFYEKKIYFYVISDAIIVFRFFYINCTYMKHPPPSPPPMFLSIVGKQKCFQYF